MALSKEKILRYTSNNMIDIKSEQETKAKCLLIGSPEDKKTNGSSLKELCGLVDTMGMEVVKTLSLTHMEPNPAYGIGSGKVSEIEALAKEIFADCIIFDWELDPRKQRNWEKLTGINCFDRNEVIIRIFAQRAQTKEAQLQVELAKLKYSLPRLSHTYGDLSRQRGGSYGTKGSGETQLELDRRQIEDKIIQIKKELSQVKINRETQRKQRERTKTASCALVGYTNAGKSSLLNALTGAEAFVEDKLFATLDPTTRKLSISEGSSVLLTDTVGFISNLPHTLIESFKSTLEEASYADLLLIVVDAGDAHCKEQYTQVLKVLKEIDANKVNSIIVLNKIDKVKDDHEKLSELNAYFPSSVKVSAKTQEGFEELLESIKENLLGTESTFILPFNRTDLLENARKGGTILNEEWLEDGIHFTARIPGTISEEKDSLTDKVIKKASTRTLALLMPYLVK